MIYNLSNYVSSNTTIIPITNGWDSESPQEAVALILTGGSDTSRGLKKDYTVQFLTRALSRTGSYKLIQAVYSLLENRFGIIFPAVTVDGETYPSIVAAQIIPIQTPGYIGTDDNGLHLWSVNFQITTRR
jgi:hypothetical protein